jgi:hypothetical protein
VTEVDLFHRADLDGLATERLIEILIETFVKRFPKRFMNRFANRLSRISPMTLTPQNT